METIVCVGSTPEPSIAPDSRFASVAFGNAIEYRFPNSMVTVDNVIATNLATRDNARPTIGATQLMPPLTQFVDPAAGDLHLTAGATAAIDSGNPRGDLTDDIDGEPRASTPDLGADER